MRWQFLSGIVFRFADSAARHGVSTANAAGGKADPPGLGTKRTPFAALARNHPAQ